MKVSLIISAKAFYDINCVSSGRISTAIQVFNNTLLNPDLDTENLIGIFSHNFDRLIDGAMRLTAMNTPENTEFNMLCVIDETDGHLTGQISGILVRNPEPFNDPKIPIDEIAQTLVVIGSNGNVDANYKVLFSKDYSKAFISNNNLNITAPNLNIRFRYLTYNGAGYVFDSNNEVTVNLEITAPGTKLCNADCGRTEVGLRDVLTADVVEGANGYEFRIENLAGTIITTYISNSSDAKLPLLQISDLRYNTSYNISVRPLISGRNTSFGQVCQISTKVLTAYIINPNDSYQGVPVSVRIEVRDNTGFIINNFNGQITLNADGNSIGADIVDIINGVGTIIINDFTSEVVNLSLTDTEGLEINIGPNQDVEFREIVANQLVIIDAMDSIQGTASIVTIKALNVAGLLDVDFNGSVTLEKTGNAVVDNNGIVNIVNGIGTISVNDNTVETVNLTLSNSSITGLDITTTHQDIYFGLQAATKLVIIDPSDVPADTLISITIEAMNSFNEPDINLQGTVTLIAIGAYPVIIPSGGLVNIINGTGTIQINSIDPQIVNLSLSDTAGTGLDVSSTQQVNFIMVEGIAFKDNFTETYGTTLELHTPDIGNSWTKIIQVDSGTLKISTNKYTIVPGTGGVGKGVLYTANVGIEYNNANYIIEMKQIEGGTADKYNYLAARILDVNNMYIVQFNKNISTLFKRFNGQWLPLISGQGTSDGAIVKFEVMGNKLKFYQNYESTILYFMDSDITTAGKAGFGMGNIMGFGGTMNTQEFDHFIVRWGGDLYRKFLDKFSISGLLGTSPPEEGSGWTQVINNGSSLGINVQNGIAKKADNGKKTGHGSFYTANLTGGYSKIEYEAELIVVDGGNADNTISIGVRVQNNGNDGYFVRFNNTASCLYKRISGVWSAIGTVNTDGVPNGSLVRLRIAEDVLQFEVDGYIVLSEVVTEVFGEGEAGFGFGALMEITDAEKDQKIDSFVVRIL